MKKIKVLHYSTAMDKAGGIAQYILNNLKYLDKSKYCFDIVTLSKSRLEIQDQLNLLGCEVHYISCYPQENESRFISELNAVFDKGYDAIHLHTPFWKGYLIEEIAMQRNIPVIIVHAHGKMIGIENDAERMKALAVHEKIKSEFNTGLATHFCACSKDAADWLFGEQIPRDRITILNNAIDIEKFSYNPHVRDKFRKELRIDDSFAVGFVGRFSYSKNPDMLIDIFNNVCKRIPKAKLVLVGTGELQERIKEKVNNYSLFDKVLFLGYRSDISELLQAMDVFVLPSRSEGLGIVLIEAQCAGLPCLASEFVPIEAKLTSNLEFLPYDASVWAERIAEIAEKPYVRNNMSEKIAEAGFSIKEQVKVLEKIYRNEI